MTNNPPKNGLILIAIISGEGDGRKLEELETLRWKPDNELTDQQLDQYLSIAKAVSLFTRAIDTNYSQNNNNNNNNSDVNDSHIEDDQKNETNSNSNQNTNHDNSETKSDKNKDSTSCPGSTSALKDNRIQCALKGLVRNDCRLK